MKRKHPILTQDILETKKNFPKNLSDTTLDNSQFTHISKDDSTQINRLIIDKNY